MTDIVLQDDKFKFDCSEGVQSSTKDDLIHALHKAELEETFDSDYIEYVDGDIEVHAVDFKKEKGHYVAVLYTSSTRVGTQRKREESNFIEFGDVGIETVINQA